MSEVPDNLVKKGYWVDQSHGAVLGATITTDARTGTLLVSFLAFLISIAATHLWNLCVFAFHQYRTNPGLGDALYHQQQVFLRTLPTAENLIVDFLRLAWTWRGKTKRTYLRCLLPSAFAVVFLCGAIAAGLFSSLGVKTGDINVLVDSDTCGYSPMGEPYNFKSFLLVSAGVLQQASNYALNCYSTTFNSIPSQCQDFVLPRLPIDKSYVPCPFGSFCLLDGDKSTLQLDTGFLDSLDHLGINAGPNDRVKFRYLTKLAPLKVADRYEVHKLEGVPQLPYTRPWLPGEEGLFLYFGNSRGQQLDAPFNNYTAYLSTYLSNTTHAYSIGAFIHGASDPKTLYGSWRADPELRVENADTTAIVLVPGFILYPTPINDPVFSAHTKHKSASLGENRNVTLYKSDYPFGVVGGTQQYEFCIKGQSENYDDCTGLIGGYQMALLMEAQKGIFGRMNYIQNATSYLLQSSIGNFADLPEVSSPILEANRFLEHGIVVNSLPDNQWESEAQIWVGYVLSKLQVWLSTVGEGPGVRGPVQKAAIAPSTPGEEFLCRSFKKRKVGGYANINVFALAFIVAISGLCLIADTALLKFIIYLRKVRERLSPRVDHWIQEGVLQLQRRAFEGQGEGVWTGLEKDIPSTVGNESLRHLARSSMSESNSQISSTNWSNDSRNGTTNLLSPTNLNSENEKPNDLPLQIASDSTPEIDRADSQETLWNENAPDHTTSTGFQAPGSPDTCEITPNVELPAEFTLRVTTHEVPQTATSNSQDALPISPLSMTRFSQSYGWRTSNIQILPLTADN